MNRPIHLLMPMSGQGTRYQKAGYTQPKPLIPVSGVPMVSRLLSNFPAQWPTHFVMAENHRQTGLPEVLEKERPEARQSFVAVHSLGPSHAVLEGLKGIPDDDAVLVTYCDYAMVWDAAQFERFVRTTDCDACLVSYRGFHAHYLTAVKYAYSRLEGDRVVEVREKGSFTGDRETEFASCGGYYFKSARLLRESIEYQVKHGLSLNGEYYTSLTTQALLQMKPQAHVRVFEIPGFFQWGTPEDLRNFEFWEKSFDAHNRFVARRPQVDQVLMPMAGLGSRFAKVTEDPKPLIPVNGTPMYAEALASLPQARKTVVVTLDSISSRLASSLPAGAQVVSLKETPSGQALSTEAGVPPLDPAREVLISSCDHGIVLNPDLWDRFHAAPDCDAAIFTVTGFPGAAAKPQSYAYVVPVAPPGGSAGDFPLVSRVSVKKPVSEQPSRDQLLVGTFWFRSAEILQEGITELKKRDVRVNGELYLDSVFEVLQGLGYRVRMIPLDGYIGWGDPDSLAEALYWQEIFCGYRIDRRPRFPGVKTHA